MNREEIYDHLVMLARLMREKQAVYERRAEKMESEPDRPQAHSDLIQGYSIGSKEAYKVCANLLEDTVKKIAKQ